LDYQRPYLLALDGDESVLRNIAGISGPHFETLTTRDPKRFMGWVSSYTNVAVVVTEHVLETAAGVALLEQVRMMRPSAKRVLLTTYHDLASIVQGIHSGAIDVLVQKPFTEVELLTAIRPPMASQARAVG